MEVEENAPILLMNRQIDDDGTDNNNNNNNNDNNTRAAPEAAMTVYARRLLGAGLVAIREAARQLQREADLHAEALIRQRMEELMRKRRAKIDGLLSFAAFAKQRFQLAYISLCLDLFVATHPNLEKNEQLMIAFQLTLMSSVQAIIRLSERFQIKMKELEAQMRRADRPIVVVGGWREVEDEVFGKYFINEEGLERLDLPRSWANEEFERDQRVEDCNTSIDNTEGFVIERLDKLLEAVYEQFKESFNFVKVTRKKLRKEFNQDLACACLLVQNAPDLIFEKTLNYFEFVDPPLRRHQQIHYGVTHAYPQRMARHRPDYITELEAFFNDDAR